MQYNYARKGLLSDETVELLFQPQRVTSYTYDRNGNMTGITYPTGRTVTYTVEPYIGLPTAVATTVNGAPQAILSNISYEPFGPLAGGTYGNGAALARGYDLRYRMTSNISGNLINVTYGYDNETNITSIAGSYDRTYGYDDLYRLTSAEGTFTVFGPVTVVRPAGGPPAPVTQTFTADNPGPNYVLRVYNGGLGDDLPRVSSGRVWLNGNLIVRPNDFNQNVRLIEKPVALQSVNELTVELQSSPQSGVTLQVIDTADPLTVPHVPGPFTIAYSYDANGNRLTKTVNGCTNTYLYAAGTNRLTQVTGGCGEDNTFSYNGRGDVIQDAFHTFEYGDHRRLVNIDGGRTAHYDYDEKLRRYNYNRLEFNSSASDQLLTEIVNVPGSNEGNFVDYIYLDLEPIARVEGDLDTPGAGETVYFYHNDHLMTPLFLSDGGQNTVWQGEYYPFGALYSERYLVDNRLRFPGQYDDRLPTGAPLYYNWNRFYMPNTGRYTQDDLYFQEKSYRYVDNNPINLYDPEGLYEIRGAGQTNSQLIRNAMKLIAKKLKEGKNSKCLCYFQKYKYDILTAVQERPPNAAPGDPRRLPIIYVGSFPRAGNAYTCAFTQGGSSYMYYKEKCLQTYRDKCDIAGFLLHEMAHLARKDPTGTKEDPELNELVRVCTMGCIKPPHHDPTKEERKHGKIKRNE